MWRSRSTARIHFDQTVQLRPLPGGVSAPARATDLSSGGIFVRTSRAIAVAARARVSFPLPDGKPVDAEATVVWRAEGEDGRAPGVALRFNDLSDADRRRVEQCVEARESETPVADLTRALEHAVSGAPSEASVLHGEDVYGPLSPRIREVCARVASLSASATQFATLTERINTGRTLDEILTHAYEAFRPLLPYDRLGLALIEDDGARLRSAWGRTTAPRIELGPGYAADLTNSSLQAVFESGRPRILNDLPAYLEGHPASDSTRRIVAEGMRSSLTCPLLVDGRAVGFLFFSSTEARRYERIHVDAFVRLASQMATAVEKGRLFEELLTAKERLERSNRELHRMSREDPLTGVANRRALDEGLDRAWREGIREQTPVSLLLLDIDGFKHFNDRYGHVAGDDSLCRVASALTGCLRRPRDLVARYGGEEFACLLPRTDGDGLLASAQRACDVVRALEIPHLDSPAGSIVTASVGAAWAIPARHSDPRELIEQADLALYRAKARGRNRVEHIAPDARPRNAD